MVIFESMLRKGAMMKVILSALVLLLGLNVMAADGTGRFICEKTALELAKAIKAVEMLDVTREAEFNVVSRQFDKLEPKFEGYKVEMLVKGKPKKVTSDQRVVMVAGDTCKLSFYNTSVNDKGSVDCEQKAMELARAIRNIEKPQAKDVEFKLISHERYLEEENPVAYVVEMLIKGEDGKMKKANDLQRMVMVNDGICRLKFYDTPDAD
jgi:hypothetical protein